jgi:RNA polymerase sigma-70 factor (ECF subfamily)
MDDDEFAELVSAAGRGDERAFAHLWRTYQPRVLRYLALVVGASAEDTAAEVWLDVARSLDRFQGGEAGFRGWLFTIARRRGLDQQRSERRRPATSPLEDAGPVVASTPGPAEEVLAQAATEEALIALASLPPDQAEIIALRVIADLDVATVASLVGKSPGAVRVAGHRGLRELAARATVGEGGGRAL